MRRLRIVSFLLMFFVIFTALPVQAFAEVIEDVRQSEEQLRDELRAAVDETQYPNGLFEFFTTRMNTSEDLSSVEFAIVRKGGTAGPASVTFKAIDVSAKYGEDYTISVPRSIFSQTLPKNGDSRTLMESINDDESDELAVLESMDVAGASKDTIEGAGEGTSEETGEVMNFWLDKYL